MRSAMRMSALSEAGVIYVMTHDSIGLGEDGPTHQVRPAVPPHDLKPICVSGAPPLGCEFQTPLRAPPNG